MAGTFTNLGIHIIFGTKDRFPMITSALQKELYPYIGGIIKNCEGIPICINGTEDHIHIYCMIPKNIAISEFIRRIKSNSSKWIHEKFPEKSKFKWQNGYGAFAVSKSMEQTVVNYISNQKEHHKKLSFQEEYLLFLKRNKIEYDPKYIWE